MSHTPRTWTGERGSSQAGCGRLMYSLNERKHSQWQNRVIPWQWHYLTSAFKNWVPHFSLSTSHASEPVKELSTCNITYSLHIHISLSVWSLKRVHFVSKCGYSKFLLVWNKICLLSSSHSSDWPQSLQHTPLIDTLSSPDHFIIYLHIICISWRWNGYITLNHWCHSLMLHNGRTQKTINLMEGILLCL